jgi:penicillin-binding protein 1A
MEVNKQNTGSKGKHSLFHLKKKDTAWKKWVKLIWIGFFA